jgi:hypothetical protein
MIKSKPFLKKGNQTEDINTENTKNTKNKSEKTFLLSKLNCDLK